MSDPRVEGAGEGSNNGEWDDPMVLEVEKLLISQLKEAFQTAVNKIVERGYTHQLAERAVSMSHGYVGRKDINSNIISAASILLTNRKKDIDTTQRLLFENVESLADFSLLEMVNVLREVKPDLSVAEAMWLLLITDLNVIHAFELKEDPVKCSSHISGGDNEVLDVEPLRRIFPQMTEKCELIVNLKLQKQQLEKSVQGWIDWTNVKIKQAAQKLTKNKAELKMLKQEAATSQKIKAMMAKVLDAEKDKVEAQIEASISSLRTLTAQQIILKKGLADSKLKSASSSNKLEEAKVREEDVPRQCKKLEGDMILLQEQLAALKGKSGNFQAQIEKATKRQQEFEVLRQHEERERTKFIRKSESIERERTEMMHKAKREEANLIAKAEANRLMFEERMNELNTEIGALKLKLEAENAEEALKRKECNVLHEQNGMNECKEDKCFFCSSESSLEFYSFVALHSRLNNFNDFLCMEFV